MSGALDKNSFKFAALTNIYGKIMVEVIFKRQFNRQAKYVYPGGILAGI
ncbi:hypothetical protein IT084_10785 [Desulfallas sp. Bu1-1]|nr:hypothetical protein [Desulfallas sp. Bu1-1]MBF7083458.1 hypothetical protein [Desulfallas sp. Bu1-1]